MNYQQLEKSLIDACNCETYRKVISEQVQQAERAMDRARETIQKAQGIFMADSLKQTFKTYNKELPKVQSGIVIEDRKKALTVDVYVGEFCEDKRHGWGRYVLPKGDKYKGQFNMD